MDPFMVPPHFTCDHPDQRLVDDMASELMEQKEQEDKPKKLLEKMEALVCEIQAMVDEYRTLVRSVIESEHCVSSE